jgi:hypothetical protein
VAEKKIKKSRACTVIAIPAMKLRSLIATTLVLLALVGILYWSAHRKPSDEAASRPADAPSILKLDESAISRLEIKRKQADPIVLSKDSGSWRILEPKPLMADPTAVSAVVSSLSSLNSERLVEDKATDLNRYGLDQPGVEVDITEKDHKAQKLLVGDDTPTGSAVYVMLGGDPRVFTIASYGKTSIDKSLNDLRDKRLLTVSPDRVSRMELVRRHQTIEFGRNKDEWQILQPQPLLADSVEVSELLRKLTDARMDLSGSSADLKAIEAAFARATPVATAKLTNESGTQELQIRQSQNDYYAKSSAVEGTYKVDADLGRSVDKGWEDFRNKKLFDFGYNDPEKIEMHSGLRAYFLSRSGSDWWSNGKKQDSASMQAFISKLRDLTARRFVASGFTNPGLEIVVTSEKGKRVEKISIAKSGGSSIAKRENEAALYELDNSALEELPKAADEIKPAVAGGR